jgi:Copper type II ascorbate-dependent monooxygenase, C-terminal domain
MWQPTKTSEVLKYVRINQKGVSRMPVRILLAVFAALPLCADGTPATTFNKDVLPILQNHCQGCHRPGEAAPMSLLTYQQARPWAAAMRQAVITQKMPPWHADPAHGKFMNDRRLSPAEIDTISNWAKNGAPEGRPEDAPPAREFTTGWTIGKPDLVLDMGADYRVPGRGTIDYTFFAVHTGFKEDKWVERVEVRPGARSVVHHIVLFARSPGSKTYSFAQPDKPAAVAPAEEPHPHEPDQGVGEFSFLDDNSGMEMIGVYVPGGDAYVTRSGQARLIKAGSDLIFQMHYTASGKESVDRSQVGFVFAKEPPKERVVNTFVDNWRMHIPPQEPNHEVDALVTLYSDVKVQSFFPHMHVRGKAMEYTAIYPGGRRQILLNVPRYDFNWQMTYQLEQPVMLPKGTQILVQAYYDNSLNNPANPDSKADVYWGEQTWEEMLAAFMDLAIPVDLNPVRIAEPEKPAKIANARAKQN